METELKKPVWVKLSDQFDRDKLSLGNRDWIENDDQTTPRKGVVSKGREYRVEAADYVIQHFIDGGDLIPVKQDAEHTPETFKEKLTALPYIGDALADTISQQFFDYEEFTGGVSLDYLTSLHGIGFSKAEEILEAIEG